MSFFGSIFKSAKKALDFGGDVVKGVTKPVTQLASKIPGGEFLAPAALSLIPGYGPYAAAGFVGADSYNKTGNFIPSLGAGVGSYFGSQLGGELGAGYGMEYGGDLIGGDLGVATGAGIGQLAGAGLGSQLGAGLGAGLTSAAGAMAGMGDTTPQSGSTLSGALPQDPKISRLAPYEGTALGDDFGGMTDQQKRSWIATRGVYGRGGGQGEQDYLVRDTNRRLFESDGSYDNGGYDVSPIEEQYFMSQGYNFNPGDTEGLLKSFARKGYA